MKSFLSGILIVGVCAGHAAGAAADEIILDYRDNNFRSGQAFYPASVQKKVMSTLSTAPMDIKQSLGETFVLLGDAPLHNSKNEGRRIIYLLSTRSPVAANPFPEGIKQYLAIVENDTLAGIYSLPEDSAYARLVGAVKLNDPDRGGALLEASFYNMGQSVTAVDLVQFDSSGASVAQTFRNTYYDGCDSPAGAKERIAAKIVQDSKGKLRSESFKFPCQ